MKTFRAEIRPTLDKINGNLILINECLKDENLSAISKWLVISSIVNPAPITPAMMKWAQNEAAKSGLLVDVTDVAADVSNVDVIYQREGANIADLQYEMAQSALEYTYNKSGNHGGIKKIYINGRPHYTEAHQIMFDIVCGIAKQDPDHSVVMVLYAQDDVRRYCNRGELIKIHDELSINCTHTKPGPEKLRPKFERPIKFMLNGKEVYTDLREVTATDICRIVNEDPNESIVVYSGGVTRKILEHFEDDPSRMYVVMKETGMKFWTYIRKETK